MKMKFTLKPLLVIVMFFGISIQTEAQGFTEGFTNITTLVPGGWFMKNNSSPLGSSGWFQGNTTTFSAQSGAATSYIGANFNNTTGGTGTISNWLLIPNRTFKNGDVFSFYTRYSGDIYPDRLQVRMSTNGASTNVGTTSTSVGDFTTLLLDINPTLNTTAYPSVFAQFTITISGLSTPTSGRIAFRYFVTSAGPTGTNSDYIGIDNVVYTPYVCPTLSVTPTSLTTVNAGVVFSQNLSQTGALGTPTYAVSAGALPAGLSLSSAGVLSGTPTVVGTFNFTITVSDASGCAGSQAYTLVIACPTFVFPVSLPNGVAGVTYNQMASVTGGVGAVAYSISAGSLPTGLSLDSNTGSISGTPTVTGTSNFDITAIDANTCTGTNSYSITIACPTLVFPASLPNGTAGVAYNQTASTSGGVGAVAYSITAGSIPTGLSLDSNTGNISGTPTVTGTYNFDITASDINACTGVSPYSVIINCPTGGASFTVSPSSLCADAGLTTISGGLPMGGLYSGTGITVSDFDPAVGTQIITYSVVDGFGCTQTANSTITVNNLPAVTASSDATLNAICNGAPVTLTGGGADTYTWNNSVANAVAFTPTDTATYMVTGTQTSTGCSATANITITVNNLPTVIANSDEISDTICSGTSVTLTGSGADTYSWNNGVTDNVSFLPLGTTTYIVTGTQMLTGCSDTDTITITVNSLPTVTASSGATSATICDGMLVVLTGGGADTYSWNNGVTDGVAFIPAGTATYLVTGTQISTGCSATANITITVNSLPTVTASSNATLNTVCNGTPVILTGGGADTYTWDNSVTDGVAFIPTGTATYMVTGVQTSTGCSATASIAVTVNNLPTVTASSDATLNTVCNGTPVILMGGGADTYTWDNSVTDGVAFTPTGTATYMVTGTQTSTGCSATASIVITVNTVPLTASSDATLNTVCNGTSVTLTGGGADTYTWNNSVTDGVAFTPTGTVTYMVMGTQIATGCSATANITITVNNSPTVTASSDATLNTVCNGMSVILTGGGADTYSWNNSVTDGVAFTPTGTATYMVTGMQTSTGCSATASIAITVNNLPTVGLTPFVSSICDNASVITLADGTPTGGVFSGTGVSGNTFNPSIGAGIYPITYTVIDGNGCQNSDSQNLQVDLCTGITSNNISTENLVVYPNPSNGLITVMYNQTIAGNLFVRITDIQGKLVVADGITNFIGAYKNSFDLSSLDKGIYMLEIIGNKTQVHNKIILE
jgi:hypothetical protein